MGTNIRAKPSSEPWTGIADLREIESAAKYIVTIVLFAIFVLSVGLAMAADSTWHGLQIFVRTICSGVIISLAAAAVGSALGFLFGIPKILQHSGDGVIGGSKKGGAENEGGTTQYFLTNTSLEEISDWLTKIIIGIGLVQFETILGYILIAASAAASFVEARPITLLALRNPEITGGTVFFFAAIVMCVLAACFFAYVETRTRLTLMFLRIEQTKLSGTVFVEALSRPVTIELDEEPGLTKGSNSVVETATDTDKALVKVPREDLRSATEIAGWASAQARSGNLREAEYALRDALQRDPGNVDVKLRLAEMFRLQGNRDAYVSAIMELLKKASPQQEGFMAAVRNAQMEALYLSPPKGFDAAIAISDYLENAKAADRPAVQLRRACAFGQKYKYINDPSSPVALVAREQALAAAKKVVELEPDASAPVRSVLRQVFDPNRFKGPPADNDLAVFKNDEDFEIVILSGHPEG
ncbi:tetratricopeptide repeat protein [Endobacterium cereale]|uniref:tetratricopeptide repeat protein n=1 Tax=Endobacterium cereale TaxID=2663029 RepID=UPI002B470FC3|nr:tetratricopeptide repeat protein [Endobacterium cereale]MEB2848101.1 tetratricopeptide repeat protein [Endobacterium cereale]